VLCWARRSYASWIAQAFGQPGDPLNTFGQPPRKAEGDLRFPLSRQCEATVMPA
jgi:hypothetical protein